MYVYDINLILAVLGLVIGILFTRVEILAVEFANFSRAAYPTILLLWHCFGKYSNRVDIIIISTYINNSSLQLLNVVPCSHGRFTIFVIYCFGRLSTIQDTLTNPI